MFRKSLARIPLPLRAEDREAGYDWVPSIWQMEASLTHINYKNLDLKQYFKEGRETRVFRPAMAVVTTNDAVLPFPLRASLNRVDAQLDELIYEGFPQAKVA